MVQNNIIVIDSRFRKNKEVTKTSRFEISYNYPIWVRAFSLKQIIIPNTQYNIRNENNVFSYVYNESIIESIEIPEGQYTLFDVLSFIEASMRATTGDEEITVSQDPFRKQVIISSPNIRITTFVVNKDRTILPSLGFTDSLSGNTIIAQELPRLTGTLNYYLMSNALSQGVSGYLGNGVKVPLITEIQLDRAAFGQFSFVEEFDHKLNTYYFPREVNLQNIDIRIVDYDNKEVDLKGLDVTIVLRTYELDSPLAK